MSDAALYLGIEAGGTRTTACLVTATGQVVWQQEAGPANLRLLTDDQLLRHLQGLALPDGTALTAIGIGMAGARTPADWARITKAAAQVWPGIPCHATNDLETALRAEPSTNSKKPLARLLVLSGTGSCCFGKSPAGVIGKVGGWGHILGDKGSGYEIGLRALKACVYYLDRDGEWSLLGKRILRTLQLNEPNDLIGWVQQAPKNEIAALAIEVFAAAQERDEIAKDILEGAAHSLAKDALACARKLAKKSEAVEFLLAGSVLVKQPKFAASVGKLIKAQWPKAVVITQSRSGVFGAIELARAVPSAILKKAGKIARTKTVKAVSPIPKSLALSPTEQRNPLSTNLDELPTIAAVELMLAEDAKLPAAILAEKEKIAQVVEWTAQAFKRGGRLFYAGAGTSGRLGILDASECPPTFRTPPEWVQGIIAGGQRAIFSAVEGAEDDVEAGARAIEFRGITAKDVVVGIAASGRTPFVWGALAEAKKRKAKTALVCLNPNLIIEPRFRPNVVIAPQIGPEILTGSTRLKSGTATKLILNIFTTLAMVKTGRVVGNLMVDLNPSNVKLRDRAARIVVELTGADYAVALAELERNGWNVKAARAALKKG
jgi:N-acetylmuramic acid 6-phosphate etherase